VIGPDVEQIRAVATVSTEVVQPLVGRAGTTIRDISTS
jgi:hypothetical protein